MKGTRLVKENGIHMKKSCATLSGCATLGASVPTFTTVHSTRVVVRNNITYFELLDKFGEILAEAKC